VNATAIAEILEYMGVMEHEINEVEHAVLKEIAIYKEEGEDYVIKDAIATHREKVEMEDFCRQERWS